MALEMAVRKSKIQKTGTIFSKTVQLLGYADDIDIVARSEQALKEAFTSFEIAAREFGLRVNEQKTKYMRAGSSGDHAAFLDIGPYKFQRVETFVYLGSEVNSCNNVSQDINRRINAANRCFHGLLKHFKSKNLSSRTKINLYKTLIRPVLTYGSETWATTKTDEAKLLIFERLVLRRVFGGVKEGEIWRRRKNRELYDVFDNDDIVRVIKLGRLRWAGHVARMNDREIPKKILTEELHRARRVGRPRTRWRDGVDLDARNLLNARNWIAAAQDRAVWQRLLEEA